MSLNLSRNPPEMAWSSALRMPSLAVKQSCMCPKDPGNLALSNEHVPTRFFTEQRGFIQRPCKEKAWRLLPQKSVQVRDAMAWSIASRLMCLQILLRCRRNSGVWTWAKSTATKDATRSSSACNAFSAYPPVAGRTSRVVAVVSSGSGTSCSQDHE